MATWTFFNKFKPRILNGNATNFSSATAVQVILIKTSPSVVPTSNTGDSGIQWVSDLVPASNEVSGTGYSRQSFGSMTVSSPSSGVVTVSGTSITYTQSASGFSNAEYIVLADTSSGSDSTSPLICCVDMVATFGNVAGTLTINTDTGNAIFTLT